MRAGSITEFINKLVLRAAIKRKQKSEKTDRYRCFVCRTFFRFRPSAVAFRFVELRRVEQFICSRAENR